MIKMDHFSIYVRDDQVSKAWYAENFGLKVEFEVPERNTVALVDDADVTLFLVRDPDRASAPHGCELTFQVDEVHRKHDELKGRGVEIVNAPQKLYWGYGLDVLDPDGYLVHVWDEASMPTA